MNKKNLLVLTLVLVMLASFTVACSNQGGEEPTETTDSTEATDSTETTDINWPNKTIEIIVPFKPGGDSDYNARTLGKYLEIELGTSVVVSNVDGSGGSIGTRQARDATPDGYTLLSNHSSFIINKANDMIDFGFEEFELVGLYASNPGDVIAVSSDSGITSLKDLEEVANANPGQTTIATNIGATTQVSSFMLADSGIDLKQVDVGGITDKVAALMGGHVDVILGPYGNIKPYIDSGDMVAIGVTAQERAEGYPDIPTCIEQGYEAYFPTRFFLAFPKGTDQAIVEKMENAVEKIVTMNEDYAKDIFEAYYEIPIFMPKNEALEEFNKIDELVNRYSLTSLE